MVLVRRACACNISCEAAGRVPAGVDELGSGDVAESAAGCLRLSAADDGQQFDIRPAEVHPDGLRAKGSLAMVL